MHRTAHIDSWYAHTARPFPDRPVLEGETEADVAILGAGYTGLSCALDLAAKGYKVAIVEAHRAGWAASGRNGGQIVTGYNKSQSTLEGLVGKEDAAKLWVMAEASKHLIEERIRRHSIECDLAWGYLHTALKPRQTRELEHMAADLARCGYGGTKLMGREETRAAVASDRYISGLYDPGSGHLHPLNYALGLAAACDAAGVRIFEESPVVAVDTGAKPTLRTEKGVVRAKHLVIAGNALLGRLMPEITRKIAEVGTYIVATEPLGEARASALIRDNIAVCDTNHALNYFRRSPDNRLLFGARASYSGRTPANLPTLMRKTMLRVYPQLKDVKLDFCWGGLVDISVNRLPHLGRVGNAFFAQGFSGHGVALTGMAGRIIAEAVAGSAERFDVFARIPHADFPGGPFRTPALVLAMAWFRFLDML
jgi:gamma-glutamylputrescine oxidase